ncbi:MAG TPA: ABC transporter substrate-binding protein [Candidatus Binatia bacterium]|jgi:NitT/TauT family transport system substrate-binding protein
MKLTPVLLVILLLFTPSTAHALENVRVAYPSMNTSVYCLIIAQKEGYLKEEGIDVQILSIRGEIAIRTALAGEIDFFTNAGSALAAAVRNVPVKIVTVFQDKPSWDLIALPTIKSISQLRGQNVAIMSPEGSLAVVAREILKKNGLDPGKDVNLVVMGGDEVRFPALKGKAIQATLFNTGTSIVAQREGFTKLASAGDYANLVQGGLATTDEKIKQNPEKIFRFIRASLKGLRFFVEKREAGIKYMMGALRLSDRETANAIYDIESKLVLRDGVSGDKTLQTMIDDMRKATKTAREIKTTEIFDLSFVRKAAEELKGWKP